MRLDVSQIEASFADYFRAWELSLPQGFADRKDPGVVSGSGWHVRYVFGTDERGDYLDFLASHRMTNERHVRLREGAAPESLPATQEMYVYDGTEVDRLRAEQEYFAHNREVGKLLRAKGLTGDRSMVDDPCPSADLGPLSTGASGAAAPVLTYEEKETKVDPDLPLIYLWEVHDDAGELVYAYVGKAKGGAKRPRTQYSRNVRNFLAGRPYRQGRPDEFRRVHRELGQAVRKGHRITLTLLCNVGEGEDINEVERQMQARYDT